MISSFMFFLFQRHFIFFCLVQQKAAKCLFFCLFFQQRFFLVSILHHVIAVVTLLFWRTFLWIAMFLFDFSTLTCFCHLVHLILLVSGLDFQNLLVGRRCDLMSTADNFFRLCFQVSCFFFVPAAFHILMFSSSAEVRKMPILFVCFSNEVFSGKHTTPCRCRLPLSRCAKVASVVLDLDT